MALISECAMTHGNAPTTWRISDSATSEVVARAGIKLDQEAPVVEEADESSLVEEELSEGEVATTPPRSRSPELTPPELKSPELTRPEMTSPEALRTLPIESDSESLG